jgi:hypothetical protein
MFSSPTARFVIGGLTWALVAYVVVFVGVVCWFLMGAPQSEVEGVMRYLFAAHFLAMLLGIGLLVVYILDVVNNPDVPSDKRVLWAIIILLGSFVGMLVYWFVHMRRPRPRTPPESPA